MASIDYNAVFQSFYSKVEAFDFLELDEATVYDFLCNWIHTAVRPTYIRHLFSSIKFDDDVMRLTYEISNPLGDEEDKDFVIELLALGIGIQWLTPQVNSAINLRQVYGSKEEKFYSQSQQITALQNLLSFWKKEQRRMICDRGYIHNDYVNGVDLITS